MKIERPTSKQPIPDHAKKVFDGVMFDVYQWQQELYDGSKKIFEKVKRPDTVLVIPVTTDKKIVLLEQEQPGKKAFLGFAGGQMEENEDVLVAAQRELLEETGMQAENFKLLEANQPQSKIEWAIYLLIGQNCKVTSDLNLDAGEKIKSRIIEFDELIDISLNHDFSEYEFVNIVMRAKINNTLNNLKDIILN